MSPAALPDWEPGTVTVLSTAAGAPHAIPVWRWTDAEAERRDGEVRAALRTLE